MIDKKVVLGGAVGFAMVLIILLLISLTLSSSSQCHPDRPPEQLPGAIIEQQEVPEPDQLPGKCTLFDATYLPWIPFPSNICSTCYQPKLGNFLLRMCYNIMVTNCFEH